MLQAKEMTLEKALESRRVLEQLLEHPGWGRIIALCQAQTDSLQKEILFTPCSGIDSTLLQEYKKGQLEGRLCLTALIETEIEVCASTIFNLRRQQDGSSGDGNGSGDTSSGGNAP